LYRPRHRWPPPLVLVRISSLSEIAPVISPVIFVPKGPELSRLFPKKSKQSVKFAGD
jgi:hypothetical protein